jgi:heterodisulfide reductase subunit D
MAVQKEKTLKNLGLCARCRQCRMVCEVPIAKTMLPICPSGEYFKYDSYYASGRVTLAKKLLLGQIDFDPSILKLIYSCALCGSCKQQCPILGFDPMEATAVLRELAVERGLADDYYPMPDEKPLKADIPEDKQSSTALFVGCEAQSDAASVHKVAGILKKSGTSFRALSGCCCGGYLLRKGDVKGFNLRKEENIARFKDMKLKRIIVHDPMCYKILKNDYALEAEGIEVVFYLEPVAGALSGRSEKTQGSRGKAAYHDPSYLGRYMGVYDLPRQVIKSLGYELTELKRERENSLSCGGFPDWIGAAADASSAEILKEVEEAGAGILITASRNCCRQLSRTAEKIDSKVVVEDLPALIEKAF